jgi:hypothetical protein
MFDTILTVGSRIIFRTIIGIPRENNPVTTVTPHKSPIAVGTKQHTVYIPIIVTKGNIAEPAMGPGFVAFLTKIPAIPKPEIFTKYRDATDLTALFSRIEAFDTEDMTVVFLCPGRGTPATLTPGVPCQACLTDYSAV